MLSCPFYVVTPARTITTLAPSTINTKRRKLERSLDDILGTPATCDLARDIQNRMRRASDQLLTFAAFPGRVDAHNNACERDLRPAVVQRKNTNGYRAMWSAKGEAVRTVVATARITNDAGTFNTVLRHHRRLTALSQAAHPVGSYRKAVPRQITQRTAGPQKIQDRIHRRAHVGLAGSTTWGRIRDQRPQHHPLRIRQIARETDPLTAVRLAMLVSPHGHPTVSIGSPESRNLDGIMILLGQALNSVPQCRHPAALALTT